MEIGPATSRAAARRLIAGRLGAVGLAEPEREASLLLTAAAELRALDLVSDPDVQLGAAAERVEAFALRRERGEPLSRICGRREFWSLSLAITADVLDPRADTEAIIEAAHGALPRRRSDALRVIEFGVGSGAVLAALLVEFPNATGVGIDRSEGAIEVAATNLASVGLGSRARVVVGDWGDGFTGEFDLIVSNPPYIPSDEIDLLAREVRDHDPRLALDGGVDGLDAYRELAPHIARLIEPTQGRFVLEHGQGQGDAVREILESQGLQAISTHKDLGGIERVVVGGGAKTVHLR